MNQVSWGLGFPLFVGHMCSIAGMTLMHWQMLAQSCKSLIIKWFAYAASKAWERGFPVPLGSSAFIAVPATISGHPAPDWESPLPSGTVLIKERHCQFRALFTIFSSWRGSMQTKKVSSLGQCKKTGNTFFVYFTGSFFKMIYLKCIRGEDNLRTHPENSKRLLGIWHLK